MRRFVHAFGAGEVVVSPSASCVGVRSPATQLGREVEALARAWWS